MSNMRGTPTDAKRIVTLSDEDYETASLNPDHHGDSGPTGWGRGIVKDLKQTVGTHWVHEMTNLNQKTFAVSLFLFFASIAPAVTFGAVYAKSTNNSIGPVETLAATAYFGIIYALIGGQPMMINGVTGPVLAYSAILFNMSKTMDVPFLTFNAWAGLWVAFFMVMTAVTDLTRILKYATRFTDEIFSVLIASIYILDSIGNPFKSGVGLYYYFTAAHKSHDEYDAEVDYQYMTTAFLSLVLGLGTTLFSFVMRGMRRSRFGNDLIRSNIADYAVVIAVIFWSLLDNTIFSEIETEKLNVPDKFAPTFQCCDVTCTSNWPNDCPDQLVSAGRRKWIVDLFDLNGKTWIPLFAVVPAFLAWTLVFLDNGISWHLVNHPSHKITHGTAYCYDTFIMAFMIAINSMLGLPWLTAATVRCLTHLKALATLDDKGKIMSIQQTRLSHLFIHLMVFGCIFILQVLKILPVPVLYGIFLYMGLTSLIGNQFVERFFMLFMQPSRYPEEIYTTLMSPRRANLYTLIQVFLFGLLMLIRVVKVTAMAFPFVILAYIPIRVCIIPKYFTKHELILLDGDDIVIDTLIEKLEKKTSLMEFVEAEEDCAKEAVSTSATKKVELDDV